MLDQSTQFCPLLNPHQVAKLLNVRRSTVYIWTSQGRLPAIRLNGRLRFRPESLKAILERRQCI